MFFCYLTCLLMPQNSIEKTPFFGCFYFSTHFTIHRFWLKTELILLPQRLAGDILDSKHVRFVRKKMAKKLKIPVMAAIAVRRKVVSIGHFSSSFYLQSLHLFLLDQIVCIDCTENQREIRLSQMS